MSLWTAGQLAGGSSYLSNTSCCYCKNSIDKLTVSIPEPLHYQPQGSWLVDGETILPLDKTALHLAVEEGDVEAAQALLAAGASPGVLDFDGCSALHLALEAQVRLFCTAMLLWRAACGLDR